MRLLSSYLIGLIFGVGIAISGMANPAKVLNFFDVAGTWDPSLAFVMGGALAVTYLGYRFVLGWRAPPFDRSFHMPGTRQSDIKLIGGSAVFGIGWGIAGFCPGAAIPALGTGRWEVALFLASVTAGFYARRFLASPKPTATTA